MKRLPLCAALALTLSACGLPEVQQARSDINRAVGSNHEARHAADTDRYGSLSSARRTCNMAALKFESDGKYAEAQKKYMECAKIALGTKPYLYTVETVRRGKEAYQEIREEKPEETERGPL